MLRGYEGIPGHDEQQKLRGSMNTCEECVTIHTNCMDPRKLGKSS